MNRLLIIDSNRITAMTVRNALYLKTPQIQVFEANTEKDAITIANEVIPELILLDFNSPMMHGPSIAEALKNSPHLGSAPIIGITPIRHLREKALQMCSYCDDWLQKPISSSQLISLISHFSVAL